MYAGYDFTYIFRKNCLGFLRFKDFGYSIFSKSISGFLYFLVHPVLVYDCLRKRERLVNVKLSIANLNNQTK